ncbi:hypothetical protein GY45DRAFT_371157 [Cubamyces sp. BRFM 1775]|nr:hypothetical protein GY45DRAFT_371157 [Cubamyces sp. BRFM 1775]
MVTASSSGSGRVFCSVCACGAYCYAQQFGSGRARSRESVSTTREVVFRWESMETDGGPGNVGTPALQHGREDRLRACMWPSWRLVDVRHSKLCDARLGDLIEHPGAPVNIRRPPSNAQQPI